MKRIISFLLSVCLLLSLCAVYVSANTSAEAEVGQFVCQYLSDFASTKYEFSDSDLTIGTISELPEDELAVIPAPMLDEISIDTGIGIYLSNKANYIQYIRTKNNSNIIDYNIHYGTPEIILEGNFAKVHVFETVGMRYDGLDEDTSISTTYDVDVLKTSDGWKICNVQSDDLFDKIHGGSFDYEAAVREYDEAMMASSPVEELVVPSEDAESIATENGAKIYTYNRSNAVNYASNYTTNRSATSTNYYNSNFPNYNSVGGDCMNFASQCVYAGFGGSDDKSALNKTTIPMDGFGSYVWYHGNQSGTNSASWTSCRNFRSYIEGSGQSPTTNNIAAYVYYTGPAKADIYDWKNRLLGAVIHVVGADGDLGHAVVVTRVEGSTGSTSDIYVSAHNSDTKMEKLSNYTQGKPFKLIVPEKYYAFSGVPAVRVTCNWKSAVTVGTSVTISGSAERKVGGKCFRLAINLISPSGKSTWYDLENTSTISKAFMLSERGLYKATIYARENNPDTTSSGGSGSCTMAVRVI